MRAVEVPEFGDASDLTLTERAEPSPDDGDVLLDVAAAGVNFADVAKRRGQYPGGPEPPYVPGIEVAGRIVEAGAETEFDVGDRVMALPLSGGYAERVAVAAEYVFPIPDGVDLTRAAAIPVQWLTAHNALFEWGDLAADERDLDADERDQDADERVLIHAAAGGVGSAAVQLAADAGATVLGTTSTKTKRDFVRDLGADHAIDYTERNVADAVAELVDEVDLVLDGVGGDAFEESRQTLAVGGRIVAYGVASGEVPRVSTPRLLFQNHAVLGYHLRRAIDSERERAIPAVERLRTVLSEARATIHVDRTFDLADAGDAHRHLEERKTMGKVLLEP